MTSHDDSLDLLPHDVSLPASPPLTNLSQELSFAFQIGSHDCDDSDDDDEGHAGTTIRRNDSVQDSTQSDHATTTEDYTQLQSSQASTSFFPDEVVFSNSSQPQVKSQYKRKETSAVETYVNKAKEISRAYQVMLKQRNLSHHSDLWKLFRILYHFWIDTGHQKIPAHHLSTLLKSDSDCESFTCLPFTSISISTSSSTGLRANCSLLIDDAIQRSFPIKWTDSRYFVDFTSMIESSGKHYIKRSSLTTTT